MSNGSIDYKLGEIHNQIKEINSRFKRNHDDLERRLQKDEKEHKEIFEAIKDLNIWRWKTIGIVAGVIATVNIGINYLFNITFK